jgi:uncharacterized protein (TIGR02246 family)
MMIAGHLEGNGMPRMIVIAAGFVLATILPASARDDTQLHQKSCQRISDQRVYGLFERWNKSLATKNPDTVVANYAKDATLLPTVKDGPLIGSEQIKAYFVAFLKQSPRGTIDQHVIHTGCNIAYDIGLYTFEVDGDTPGTRREIKARYTFVYVPDQGKWLIAHHHSSKVPEDAGAHASTRPFAPHADRAASHG